MTSVPSDCRNQSPSDLSNNKRHLRPLWVRSNAQGVSAVVRTQQFVMHFDAFGCNTNWLPTARRVRLDLNAASYLCRARQDRLRTYTAVQQYYITYGMQG